MQPSRRPARLAARSFPELGHRRTLLGPAFSSVANNFILAPPGGRVLRDFELRALLVVALSPYLQAGALRDASWFDDEFYYLPTYAEMEAALNAPRIQLGEYQLRVFDCEDFAYATRADLSLYRLYDATRGQELTPFASGILWGENLPTVGSGRHALNLMVTSTEHAFLIDRTEGSQLITPLPPARAGLTFDYVVI